MSRLSSRLSNYLSNHLDLYDFLSNSLPLFQYHSQFPLHRPEIEYTQFIINVHAY